MQIEISHKDLTQTIFINHLKTIEKNQSQFIVIQIGSDLELHIHCTTDKSNFQYITSLRQTSDDNIFLYHIMALGYLDIKDDPEKWYKYYRYDKEHLWHDVSHLFKMYDEGRFNEQVSELSELNYNMHKLCMYLDSRLYSYLIYYSIEQLSENSIKLHFKDYYGYQLPSMEIDHGSSGYQIQYTYKDQPVTKFSKTATEVLREVTDLDRLVRNTKTLYEIN